MSDTKQIMAAEWFVVGPPWLAPGLETYIVAGSPDPQAAIGVVCDMPGDHMMDGWDDNERIAYGFQAAQHICDLHNASLPKGA